MLAVTAILSGGDLLIDYNAAGDLVADISSDGTNYSVSGTGLAPTNFLISTVTGKIVVADKAAIVGQTFTVNAGKALANALQVNSNVETSTLTGGITTATAGDVTIGSPTISLANDISTAATNGNITLSGATTLSKAVSLSTGAGAGNISFASTLDGAQTLSLTAGTGDVTFSGAVGGTTRLGAITIVSAKDVTAAAIKAASLSQAAGSGTTTLNGAVDTNAAAGVSLTGTNLAVNSTITTSSTGTVTFNQLGTITIAAAGDVSADGKVGLKAAGGITTAGDITTTDDNVTFASKTTLSGPVAISTGAGAGDISFADTLDGAKTLGLTAGTGAISFTGAVGSTAPLAGIKIDSAASTTFSSTAKLDGSPVGAFGNGLAIAASVNTVTLNKAGSEIKNFASHGVYFAGGSTGSTIANVDIRTNKVDGIHIEPGTYTSSKLQANTIGSNTNGILLGGNVLGLLVDGNFIGTKSDLTTDIGNTGYGIRAEAGDYAGTVIQSNSIAFNDGDGVYLSAAGTAITNLTVGGDKTATPSLGNAIYSNDDDGIQADFGDFTGTVIQGNSITKNGIDGIYLNANGVTLSNLLIGAGVGGNQAKFGNRIEGSIHGVHVTDGTFTGTAIAGGNEIGLNTSSGIYLEGDVLQLAISENSIGMLLDGTDRGNLLHGIEAEAGDYAGSVIQGNQIGFNDVDGIRLAAAGDKVTNLTINALNTIYANDSDGIQADNGDYTGTVIRTNLIFTNAVEGIYLAAAGDKVANLTIGGDKTAVPSQGNQIFSNKSDGIQADNGSYSGTVIQGNQIGSPSGSFTLSPGSSSVKVAGDVTAYIFPGQAIFLKPLSPAPAVDSVKRVITAVALLGGNTVVSLSAPIDATTTGGTAVVGNLENGIFLNTASDKLTDLTIGGGKLGASKLANEIYGNTLNGIRVGPGQLSGSVIAERNEITLNGTNGIELLGGVQDLLIQRNLIGLKSDNKAGNGNTLAGIYATGGYYGPSPLPGAPGTQIVLNTIGYNGTNGVELEGATNLTVGGLPQTNGNTILRNTLAGVLASGDSAGTTVKSNLIDRNKFGVQLDNATGITIGGPTTKESNTITGNTAAGVEAMGTLTGSKLLGNIISGSTTGVALIDARNFAVGGDKLGEGNRVSSNTQGLTAQGDSAGTNVLGNAFTGNDVGAQLVGSTGLTIGGGDNQKLGRNVFDANAVGVSASGLLTGTTVHGNIIKNGVTGVSLDNAQEILIGGATPLAGNVVETQSTNGVFATGLLTGSSVRSNAIVDGYVGVTLDNAEGLLVDSNSIRNNTKTGVSAFGNLVGTTVSSNHLVANESGIVLHDLNGIGIVHDLTVTKNVVEDSTLDGIFATGDLTGTTVTGNTVNRSGVSGISLQAAQNLPVSDNTINDSGENGIYATGDLTGSSLTKNVVTGSGENGIALVSATKLPVSDNTVTTSVKNGVFATGNLLGTSVTKNTIEKSGEAGIALVSATNLPVSSNTVSDSGKIGVYASGDLTGSSVASNSVLRSGEAGISLDSARNLPVTNNTVADSLKRGLYATGDSTGTEVVNNVFSNSGTDGAVLDAATNLLVTSNVVNDSGNRGLYAKGDLFGSKVDSNSINRSQGEYATVFDSATNLLFSNNGISDSLKSGFYATGDSFGTKVQTTTIKRTQGAYGMVLNSAANLSVTTTNIDDSAQGGLFATGGLSGTSVTNIAVNRSQGDFAVVLQAAQNLEFTANKLVDSAKSGLFAGGDLTGTKVLSNGITNTGTVESQHVSASLIDATNLVFGDVGAGNIVTGGAGAGLFTSGNLLGTTVKGNLFDQTRSGIVLSKTQNATFGGAVAGEGNTIIGGGSLPLGQYRDGVFAAGDSAGSTLTGTVIEDAWIGVSLNWADNLTVSQTTVTNQQGIGLFAQGTATGATVTGMSVVRTVAPTLDTSGAVLNAVTGLTLSNSQFNGDTTALFVFEDATDTKVVSSQFSGLTTGAGLFSARNLVFGLIGQGNSVAGGQTGAFVSGGMSGTALTGNMFKSSPFGTGLGLVSATGLRVASNTITGSGVGLYTNGQSSGTRVMSNLIDSNVTGFSITATRNLTFGSFSERNTISNSSYAGLIASGNCVGSVVLYTNWSGNAVNVIDNASPPLAISPAA